MRVAVYYNNNDIRIEERPIPKIGPGEILVKVMASGICGSDVLEWHRVKKGPRVLGHEITGVVADVGEGVKGHLLGARVFVSHHVPCNTCKYCKAGNHTACAVLHEGNYDPGGFSEFIRVPKINVENGIYVLPGNISFEKGTMLEPLACVLRGQKIADIEKGQTVLILGSGVSGLLHAQLAKIKLARVIVTDVNDYRLKIAEELGADEVVHVKAADENLNIKADRIIVCTSAPQAVQQAFNSIDRKGAILFFAVPNRSIEIPTADFWRNEITITSSYGAAPRDLDASLSILNGEYIKVKSLITHMLPLEEIQKGFQIAAEAKESLKVVLKP
ncbi:MAG: alcohol dehydrogenase catalytic domain-containing protein [Candidatus Omnitrophica bacterium]|nr:alcohol dehydrogenase catalytic domain-containing protein [Candidatus Omnitrophota bacterium]